MARRIGDRAGGILGLLELVEQHQEAIEYELLRIGRRLRDLGTRLTWRDLLVLVRGWQKSPHNAVSEAIHGYSVWTIEEQLLAELIDVGRMANWQRQNKPHAAKPKRTPRPWERQKETRRLGRDAIPISAFDDWWESKAKVRAET